MMCYASLIVETMKTKIDHHSLEKWRFYSIDTYLNVNILLQSNDGSKSDADATKYNGDRER